MTQTINLSKLLSAISSFEDFEALKSTREVGKALAQEIIERHRLPHSSLELFSEGTNIVFSYGNHTVIKIFPPFHADQFKSDLLVLKHLHGKLSVKTPTLYDEGEIYGWPYLVMSELEGTLLETLWDTLEYENKVILIRELGSLIREVHSLPTKGLEEIDSPWDEFIKNQIDHCVEHHSTSGLPTLLLEQIPSYLESTKAALLTTENPVLLLGEYTPMNLLVKKIEDRWHLEGLIDFGDAMLGLPEYDLLGPGAFLIQGNKSLLREFLRAYGYTLPQMTPALSHQLTALMLLHKYSNLEVQVRIKDGLKVATLQDLERLVWGM